MSVENLAAFGTGERLLRLVRDFLGGADVTVLAGCRTFRRADAGRGRVGGSSRLHGEIERLFLRNSHERIVRFGHLVRWGSLLEVYGRHGRFPLRRFGHLVLTFFHELSISMYIGVVTQ